MVIWFLVKAATLLHMGVIIRLLVLPLIFVVRTVYKIPNVFIGLTSRELVV